MAISRQYVRSIELLHERVPSFEAYPYSIPAIRSFQTLMLSPHVTFLVGENGSGKSTLIEAIAVALGFNAEGGSRNFRFATRSSESSLHNALRVVRGTQRPKDGFFLRAESYFNLGTEIEKLDAEPANAPPIINSFGHVSLHEQSHGESFLALAKHRFGANGIYVLDEPEAALSPSRQLAFLRIMKEQVDRRSQFIIATHSPILMAYPGASIYHMGAHGPQLVPYEETEHFELTRSFLNNPKRYIDQLFAGD